ncbi:4Fe-4S binding protein [Candidatus Aenigmatarchaeota archaeon]
MIKIILTNEIKYKLIDPTTQRQREVSKKTIPPRIDKKKCTVCHLCFVLCPHNCIEMKNECPSIKENECSGCLICLRECPFKAIEE